MSRRTIGLALVLALAALVRLPASSTTVPVDEIEPGMIGVGRTVFEGTEAEEFTVHILGVLRNVMGPQRNLILARLEGGPLSWTGVIAGMSGSPVYIDGRLIGAVSYSLGSFAREPIAGITPIGEMTDAAAWPERRPAPRERVHLDLPVTPDSLARALSESFGRARPFAERPGDVQAVGLEPAAAAHMGVLLRPIATPLMMGGFEPEASELLMSSFGSQGFAPVATGTQASLDGLAGQATTLEAGSALGVSLVRGDLSLGGTGTVTLVDGDRVYAFGHPFFNLGPTEFPMTRAYIHTLLPSLSLSAKIATLGEVIGTIHQDRATAIAGLLGSGPNLIPIRVTLESDRGPARSFRFEVVNDQLFTPLLTYASILSTLSSYERQFGAATFTVRGRAALRDHGEVALEDIFTGEAASTGAASYVAAPLIFLLRNDFAPVTITEVDLTIVSTEEPRTATIERVWLDAVRPRAGDTVPVKILTRTYRGEEAIHTVDVEIPPNARGGLSILVADGTRLAQFEQRELRRRAEPQNLTQMIRLLNSARRNSSLYVQLLSNAPGAVVSGEALTALPPSVLAILEGDRSGGSYSPLRTATLGEWELATDHAVTGLRLLSVAVEPD